MHWNLWTRLLRTRPVLISVSSLPVHNPWLHNRIYFYLRRQSCWLHFWLSIRRWGLQERVQRVPFTVSLFYLELVLLKRNINWLGQSLVRRQIPGCFDVRHKSVGFNSNLFQNINFWSQPMVQIALSIDTIWWFLRLPQRRIVSSIR